jgi:hypothetical protein
VIVFLGGGVLRLVGWGGVLIERIFILYARLACVFGGLRHALPYALPSFRRGLHEGVPGKEAKAGFGFLLLIL